MALVPGYDYDIFVSYARVDDQPVFGMTEGWVTRLVGEIKILLAQRLGRADAFAVWMDHQLPRHVKITDEISDTLRQTAILIVVLSRGYLASEWCGLERRQFLAFVQERIRAGARVFLIERDSFPLAERPPEFGDLLGYRFWVEDRPGKPPTILGLPQPDQRYYDLLNDLSHDLANELHKLADAASATGRRPVTAAAPVTGRLPFANRDAELQFLAAPDSPRYIHISAPSGYGKTALLHQMQELTTQKKQAQVVLIDFSLPAHRACRENQLAFITEVAHQTGLAQLSSNTPERAVRELAAHWMQAQQPTLLLLDSLENMTDAAMRDWLKKEFFRLLEKAIPARQLHPKVISAGRYNVQEWKGYIRPYFHFHRLTPLDDPAIIDELLHKVVPTRGIGEEWFDGMVQEILFLTKGHPKCIAAFVLSYLAEQHFAVAVDELAANRREIFQTYLAPILRQEILADVSDDPALYHVVATLSALRGINLSALGFLAEQRLLLPLTATPDWPKELLARLRKFRFVDLPRENSPLLYPLEPIIRELLALQVSFTNPQQYWQVHRAAAQMFDAWIIGQDLNGQALPVRLTDGMQAQAIVEGLYHHAHLLANAAAPNPTTELVAILHDRYLPALRTNLGDDVTRVAALVLDALEEDAEFRALIFRLFSEDVFTQVLQPVKQLVAEE